VASYGLSSRFWIRYGPDPGRCLQKEDPPFSRETLAEVVKEATDDIMRKIPQEKKKEMNTYQIELPESAFSSLKKEPAEFIAEMKCAAAVKWYEVGAISQAKAAEIAGLSRYEFISLLGRYGVSVIQYTEESLSREIDHALR
jgi:predicted HTH domain antitoxin